MTDVLEIFVHDGLLEERTNNKDNRKYYVYSCEKKSSEKAEQIVVMPDVLKDMTKKEARELLAQLNARLKSLIIKMGKDEILFGTANASDIAEKARLEFQINNLKKQIND
jgi:ribosomal protein L9